MRAVSSFLASDVGAANEKEPMTVRYLVLGAEEDEHVQDAAQDVAEDVFVLRWGRNTRVQPPTPALR